MLADIGTRRGASIKQVNNLSEWINGQEWMKYSVNDMPIKSIKDIKLKNEDIKEAMREMPSTTIYQSKKLPNEIHESY